MIETVTVPVRTSIYTVDLVDAVCRISGDTVTVEQVSNVLSALDSLAAGDPVGTVCIDDATGRVSVRVQVEGVVQWRVIAVDGSQYNDLTPTLSWRQLYSPDAEVDVTPVGPAPPVEVRG